MHRKIVDKAAYHAVAQRQFDELSVAVAGQLTAIAITL